jgi:glycosyltransferase involved in cell wall biosynthesis
MMKKSKHILVVIDSLGYGGAERLLVSLLPRLSNRHIKIDVAVLFSDLSLMKELIDNGVNVVPLNIKHRWSVVTALVRLSRVLKNGHYDIVWGHLFFGNMYSSLLKTIFTKLKIIWTLHSPGYSNNPPKKAVHKIKKGLEKYLGRYLVDSIVAVSKSVASDYQNTTKWNSISVIYNGVDFSNFPTAPPRGFIENIRKRLKITKSCFLIVTPGRYVLEKGHNVMVEAIEILINKYNINVCWIAIGSGPLKNNIQDLVNSKQIIKNIMLLDSMPHMELLNFLRSSDLVVVPSIREPFGIVAVESMGMGLPILTTNVDGLIEVIGSENRLNLVPPNDSIELVKSILYLFRHEKIRKNTAKIGMERAYRLFDIEICTYKWNKLINSL